MNRNIYTKKDLNKLQELTVPTVANAIETFHCIPSNEGFCNPSMLCRFPEKEMMAGYAVTSRVSTDQIPGHVLRPINEHDYWEFVYQLPGPKVAVCKDIDNPPYGAMWGEFNSNLHVALGCVGAVVDGAVRDLDGVRDLDFHYFSTAVTPTHGNGYFIDYGAPVRIAGLEIRTGDLLVGDRHGILLIPEEIPLDELIDVGKEIDKLESEVFTFCRSPHFTVKGMAELDQSVSMRWPDPRGKKPKTEGLK